MRSIAACEINREAGASAVEYSLLVAAIAAVIVGIVFVLGSVLNHSYAHSCDQIATAVAATCG